MKCNQIISSIPIQLSNEEKQVMERIGNAEFAFSLSEREKQVTNNLIRKSLLKKVKHKDSIMVVPSEFDFK